MSTVVVKKYPPIFKRIIFEEEEGKGEGMEREREEEERDCDEEEEEVLEEVGV